MLKRKIGAILGIAAFVAVLVMPGSQLVCSCLAITALAAFFWMFEVLPLYVTAMLVAVLLPVMGVATPKQALSPFFSPIIALMLGGFLIARSVERYGLDRRIAAGVLRRAGAHPDYIIFGMMISTALLSSFMSNTATTALMLAVGLSVLRYMKSRDRNYSVAMMLAIAYSANIGGVLTLIGTPPNLIAVSGIQEMLGVRITFLQWSAMTVPFGIVMLLAVWRILVAMYPADIRPRALRDALRGLEDMGELSGREWKTLAVLALAVAFWATESLHGIHYGIVGLAAAVLLYALKLLDDEDMMKINWPVLILLGGGLSLGGALAESGSAEHVVQGLFGTLAGVPYWLLLAGGAVVTLALTNLASNTAATALLVPLVIPLAAGLGVSGVGLAVLVGIAGSLAFILPVGTPPNAIVYGSKHLKIGDMIRAGVAVTAVTIPLFVLFALTYWKLII